MVTSSPPLGSSCWGLTTLTRCGLTSRDMLSACFPSMLRNRAHDLRAEQLASQPHLLSCPMFSCTAGPSFRSATTNLQDAQGNASCSRHALMPLKLHAAAPGPSLRAQPCLRCCGRRHRSLLLLSAARVFKRRRTRVPSCPRRSKHGLTNSREAIFLQSTVTSR